MLQSQWQTQIAHCACSQCCCRKKMAALLLQELDGSEIAKLPKTIHNKLERILSDQQYEIDSLKAQQEQFRVDSGKKLPGFVLASGAKVSCLAHHARMSLNGTTLKWINQLWTYQHIKPHIVECFKWLSMALENLDLHQRSKTEGNHQPRFDANASFS